MPVRIHRPGDLKGRLQGATAAVLYGAQTNYYTALHVALLVHSDPFNAMRRQAVHFTSAKADSLISDLWVVSAESGSCPELTYKHGFVSESSQQQPQPYQS